MARADEASEGSVDVLVFKSLDAEARRGRLAERSRRRPRRAEPAHTPPEPVSITRVTVIAAEPFADEQAAAAWLEQCRDARESTREIDYAIRRVNRAVQAHRLSAGDPYVSEVRPEQARRVRLGFGTGDELVEGAWRKALTVSAENKARDARRALLAPQEQVARILSARRPPQPSEDILLRARLDLDEGRTRQAALQARAAHGALQAEHRAEAGADQVVAVLRARSELMSRLATVALERALDAEQAAKLAELVVEMEKIARRRRHAQDEPDRPRETEETAG
jgi:hypothetical protein